MVAYLIGLLMALGLISSSTEFNNLPQSTKSVYMDWVGEDDPSGM